MSETLRRVQTLVLAGEYRVSRHGFRELAADDIVLRDVMAGITAAVVVEDYPDNRMEPSVLILQHDRTGRSIHVMWGVPKATGMPAILVTAYRPAPERWSADFKRDMTRTRKSKELMREGKYAAEVDIELEYSDESWSPTMSADDARKLEAVRLALRAGNVAEAAKHGRVFELTPVAAK
jgi:transposase-like protein